MFNLFTKKQPPPTFGQRIEITWLPNTEKHPKIKNSYIGSIGTVRKVYEDGSFDLSFDYGGMLMVGKQYRYKVIK